MYKIFKKLTATACALIAAATVVGILPNGVFAVSQSVLLSEYKCDFENNYYADGSVEAGKVGAVDTDGGENVFKFAVNSNAADHRFEVYNSEKGVLELADNRVYVVSLKYKVLQIGGTDTTAATYINIVRHKETGNEIAKIDVVPDAMYYPGNTTEWLTRTVVFKVGEISASGYTRLGINVVSASCPSVASNGTADKTIILFDDITVTECDASANALVFNSNGGSYTEAVVAKSGESVEIAEPTRDLYDFDGWYTDSNFTKKFTSTKMPSSFITRLYAKWKPSAEAATVDFVTGNGENPETAVGRAGDPITLPKLSRDGFRFAGWYSADYSEKHEFTVFPEGNTTVYAKWELVPTYCGFENKNDFHEPDNGVFTMRCIITDEQKSNGKYSLHYSFQRGFELSGSAGKSTPAGVLLVDENGEKIRLESGEKYTVSFKYKVLEYKSADAVITLIASGSGGAWNDRAVQDCSVSYDASDVGKGWQSHTFTVEWAPKSDSSNYINIAISGESVICVDDIVICKYDKNVKYPGGMMVCFDNGDGPSIDTVYAKYGETVALPTPEREGYRFLGWSYDANGEKSVEGDSITVEKMYTVIYADWYKIPDEVEAPAGNDEPKADEAPVVEKPAAEENKDESNTLTVVIIIVVAAVVIAAAAVIVLLIIRRKKPSDAENTDVKE